MPQNINEKPPLVVINNSNQAKFLPPKLIAQQNVSEWVPDGFKVISLSSIQKWMSRPQSNYLSNYGIPATVTYNGPDNSIAIKTPESTFSVKQPELNFNPLRVYENNKGKYYITLPQNMIINRNQGNVANSLRYTNWAGSVRPAIEMIDIPKTDKMDISLEIADDIEEQNNPNPTVQKPQVKPIAPPQKPDPGVFYSKNGVQYKLVFNDNGNTIYQALLPTGVTSQPFVFFNVGRVEYKGQTGMIANVHFEALKPEDRKTIIIEPVIETDDLMQAVKDLKLNPDEIRRLNGLSSNTKLTRHGGIFKIGSIKYDPNAVTNNPKEGDREVNPFLVLLDLSSYKVVGLETKWVESTGLQERAEYEKLWENYYKLPRESVYLDFTLSNRLNNLAVLEADIDIARERLRKHFTEFGISKTNTSRDRYGEDNPYRLEFLKPLLTPKELNILVTSKNDNPLEDLVKTLTPYRKEELIEKLLNTQQRDLLDTVRHQRDAINRNPDRIQELASSQQKYTELVEAVEKSIKNQAATYIKLYNKSGTEYFELRFNIPEGETFIYQGKTYSGPDRFQVRMQNLLIVQAQFLAKTLGVTITLYQDWEGIWQDVRFAQPEFFDKTSAIWLIPQKAPEIPESNREILPQL